MATCPFCRQGSLRIIAASTQAEVIRKLLHPLKLVTEPPPIALPRARQETSMGLLSPHHRAWTQGDVRIAEGDLSPLSVGKAVCR